MDLRAEGATRAEALTHMRTMIEQRLQSGAEVVAMSVGSMEHPLKSFAGKFKDDPLLEEWKDAVEEYRGQYDTDPSAV